MQDSQVPYNFGAKLSKTSLNMINEYFQHLSQNNTEIIYDLTQPESEYIQKIYQFANLATSRLASMEVIGGVQ